MDLPTLRAERLIHGGRALGRVDGEVWFVPDLYPSELARVAVTRRHSGYVEGRVVERLEDAPARRPPACPVQPWCGGCPWMTLDEPTQRVFKGHLLKDALSRIGGFHDLEPEVIVASGPLLGYRNRVELTLGVGEDGAGTLGFFGGRSGETVEVTSCAVQHVAANGVLQSLHELLSGEADLCHREQPYRVTIRRSWASGEMLVVWRETVREFAGAAALAAALAERHPELVGVVRLKGRPGRRGGARIETLFGRDWLEEQVAGLRFRLPAACFVQINPAAGEGLLQLVLELAGPVQGKSVLDLYGGIGIFGLSLARGGATATVCEADAQAVRAGRQAARDNGRLPVQFVHARVGEFLSTAGDADVVVANPPRSGLGRSAAEAICGVAPARLVLVSCDPPTLARDLRRLVDRGYRVGRIVPVDLFPQTPHVETVVVLDR